MSRFSFLGLLFVVTSVSWNLPRTFADDCYWLVGDQACTNNPSYAGLTNFSCSGAVCVTAATCQPSISWTNQWDGMTMFPMTEPAVESGYVPESIGVAMNADGIDRANAFLKSAALARRAKDHWGCRSPSK